MSLPEGWIQERFLRFKRYIAQVSSSAEAANVIPVTVSLGLFEKRELLDAVADGNSPDSAIHARSEYGESIGSSVIVELVDLATGLRPAATAFTITATSGGDGTVNKGSGTAFITAELGDAGLDLDITDVVGGSAKELAVVVRPISAVGGTGVGIITFD